jgi:tetratricopeptide (TPR) repeat protein
MAFSTRIEKWETFPSSSFPRAFGSLLKHSERAGPHAASSKPIFRLPFHGVAGMIPRSTTVWSTPGNARPHVLPNPIHSADMSWSRSISGLVILVSPGIWLVSITPAGVPSLPAVVREESSDLLRLREEGNRLFAAQRYERASEIYDRGRRESLGRRQIRPAVRFLNNLAGCQFALFRYQKAVELYLEAQRLARPIRFAEMLGMISLNLAGIYLQMGDAG